MGTLTDEAERALLGAVLQDPDLILELGYLTPGDFQFPRHRVLYAAITRAARDRDGEAAWRTAADPDSGPDLPPGYLEELTDVCPDPRHAPAYAALVLEAGFQRTLLASSEESTGQAMSIGQGAYRLRQARSTAAFAGVTLASHAAQVAHAIGRQAAAFRPDRRHAPAAPSSPAANRQGKDEELVLGALISGHADVGRILSTVGPGAFRDPLRRDLFIAARAAHAAGHPVDPVTVDWEIGRQAAWQYAGHLTTVSGRPGYAAWLAETATVDEDAALATARQLASRQPQAARSAVSATVSDRVPGRSRSPQALTRPTRPAPMTTSPGLIQPLPDLSGNGHARDRGGERR
jgi:replicative DNA helicase